MDTRHKFHLEWFLRHSNISIMLLIVTGLLLYWLGKGQILPLAGGLIYFAGVFWLIGKVRWLWRHPIYFLLLSIFSCWFGFKTGKYADSVMWQLLGSVLAGTAIILLLLALIWIGFVVTGVWKWTKKNYIDPQIEIKDRYWNSAERQRQSNSCTTESPTQNGHRLHLEQRRNLRYICAFLPFFPAATIWSVVISKVCDTDAISGRFVDQVVSGQVLAGWIGILLSLLWAVVLFIMLVFLAIASITLVFSMLIHIYSRLGMYQIEEDGGGEDVK